MQNNGEDVEVDRDVRHARVGFLVFAGLPPLFLACIVLFYSVPEGPLRELVS